MDIKQQKPDSKQNINTGKSSELDKLEILKKLAQVQKKRQQRQQLRLLLVLVLLCVLGIGAYNGYERYQEYSFINQVPKNIRSETAFPLYLPENLPNGYSFSRESVNNTSAVVSYYIQYEGSKKLIFTLQPKPTEINTEDFGRERLLDSKEVTLPIGKAHIGSLLNVPTTSVITEETWILITAPSGIPDKDLRFIIRSLKKL